LQGQVLTARGNSAGARTVFTKALQIDRDAIDALSGLLDLEIKAGQAAKIRPQIEQALARHPKDPAYLLLSAEVAAAEGIFPRAEQSLRAILDANGAREDAALMLTSVLADQSRLKEAQAVAEKSLERLPMSSRIRMKLAEILELQGLALESQTQYEQVMSDNQLAGATTDMNDAFNTASAQFRTEVGPSEHRDRSHRSETGRLNANLGWQQVRFTLFVQGDPTKHRIQVDNFWVDPRASR